MVQRSQYFKEFPLDNAFKGVLEKIKQVNIPKVCS